MLEIIIIVGALVLLFFVIFNLTLPVFTRVLRKHVSAGGAKNVKS